MMYWHWETLLAEHERHVRELTRVNFLLQDLKASQREQQAPIEALVCWLNCRLPVLGARLPEAAVVGCTC